MSHSSPFGPVHVLLNPASGGGTAGRRWRNVSRLAAEIFPGLILHHSDGPGSLTRIARVLAESGEPAVVIGAGGDGTSHEVLNGIAPASGAGPGRIRMGWLPLGSGNDLARAVGVPNDPRRALQSYRRMIEDRIDLGTVRFTDTDGAARALTFGNSLTFGLSAEVLERVGRANKRMGGRIAYFIGTARALLEQQEISFQLTVDGDQLAAEPARLVSITNGPSLGAGMRIAPMARLADGQLELLWIGGLSRIEALVLFPRVYFGSHLDHPRVRHRRIATMQVDAPRTLGFEVDGELYRGQPPFQVEVSPGRLSIVRPA